MSLEVNVTKRFDGFTLHAAFTAGDTATALLGASGCGKSMTLRCPVRFRAGSSSVPPWPASWRPNPAS